MAGIASGVILPNSVREPITLTPMQQSIPIIGKWAVNEIFGPDAMKAIENPGEKVERAGWVCEFDQKHDMLRFNPKGYLGMPFNVKLDERHESIAMIGWGCHSRAEVLDKLVSMADNGLMAKDAFEKMGISEGDLRTAVENMQGRSETEKRIYDSSKNGTDLTGRLPATVNAPEKSVEAAHIVGQGEAAVATVSGDEIKSLYTFGARPCTIIAVIGKDAQGKVAKIGLTHVDTPTELDLLRFIRRADAGGSMEAYVFGGITDTMVKTFSALEEHGVEIKHISQRSEKSKMSPAMLDRTHTLGDDMLVMSPAMPKIDLARARTSEKKPLTEDELFKMSSAIREEMLKTSPAVRERLSKMSPARLEIGAAGGELTSKELRTEIEPTSAVFITTEGPNNVYIGDHRGMSMKRNVDEIAAIAMQAHFTVLKQLDY